MERTQEEIERLIIESAPYPIAAFFSRVLPERNPQVRITLILDAFTVALKYIALITLSEYLSTGAPPSDEVYACIRNLERPSLGHWYQFLRTAIDYMEKTGAPLKIEDSPGWLGLIRNDKALKKKVKELAGSQQDLISTIINYRNQVSHGLFARPTDKVEAEEKMIYSLLLALLESIAPFYRHTLCRALPESSPGKVAAARMTGLAPFVEESLEIEKPETDIFLLLSTGRTLCLYPFFLYTSSKDAKEPLGDLLLYDQDRGKFLVYLNIFGDFIKRVPEKEALVQILALQAPSAGFLDSADLTLDELRKRGSLCSLRQVNIERVAAHYIPEAYTRRKEEQYLEEFLQSPKGIFILSARSGRGKTSLLARFAEEQIRQGDIVLFNSCSAMAEPEPEKKVLRDLAVKATLDDMLEFLTSENEKFIRAGARPNRMILIFDGVNEFLDDRRNPEALFVALRVLADKYRFCPYLKIIISIRESYFQMILPSLEELEPSRCFCVQGAKESPCWVVLSDFTEKELERAYENYAALAAKDPDARYAPTTPFKDLSAHMIEAMRNPLNLRIVLAAYNGEELPAKSPWSEVMKSFFAAMVKNSDVEALVFRRLVSALEKRKVKAISLEDLADSGEDTREEKERMRQALFGNDEFSPLVRLKKRGLVQETWILGPAGLEDGVSVGHDLLYKYLMEEKKRAAERQRFKSLLLVASIVLLLLGAVFAAHPLYLWYSRTIGFFELMLSKGMDGTVVEALRNLAHRSCTGLSGLIFLNALLLWLFFIAAAFLDKTFRDWVFSRLEQKSDVDPFLLYGNAKFRTSVFQKIRIPVILFFFLNAAAARLYHSDDWKTLILAMCAVLPVTVALLFAARHVSARKILQASDNPRFMASVLWSPHLRRMLRCDFLINLFIIVSAYVALLACAGSSVALLSRYEHGVRAEITRFFEGNHALAFDLSLDSLLDKENIPTSDRDGAKADIKNAVLMLLQPSFFYRLKFAVTQESFHAAAGSLFCLAVLLSLLVYALTLADNFALAAWVRSRKFKGGRI